MLKDLLVKVKSFHYSAFLVSSDYIRKERYYAEQLTCHTVQVSNGSARVKPSGPSSAARAASHGDDRHGDDLNLNWLVNFETVMSQ